MHLDSRYEYGYINSRKDYAYILNKLIDNKWLGLILKPKKPGLLKLKLAGIEELFEKIVEDDLIEPTFIIDYPVEVSPLSRLSDDKEGIVDRFELFIGGNEIANGFSELNDPEDQAERFKAQVEQKASGDEEAMEYDADYIEALEYGLPPCAGVGIGIDRLVMLFTGAESIRDVLLFPQMKPKS